MANATFLCATVLLLLTTYVMGNNFNVANVEPAMLETGRSSLDEERETRRNNRDI